MFGYTLDLLVAGATRLGSQMFLKKLLLLGLIALVAGCAAKYHAAETGSSGYRDIQVKPGVYYVEYTESANRKWEVIHQFALKRCAEIAKQQGYKYFDVLSKDEKTVFLESDVDQLVIQTAQISQTYSPVHSTVPTEGKKVEGRRVVYKIKLVNE